MKPGDLLSVNNSMDSYYLYSKNNVYKDDIGIIIEVIMPLVLCLIRGDMILLYPDEFTIIENELWN